MAACDPAGVLAYPLDTVTAGPAALATLVRLIEEHEPVEVVMGLPRSLSGQSGPAAVKVTAAATALQQALADAGLPVPVRLVDERLSTVAASRRLRDSGLSAKQQRSRIDAAAAAGILQAALDGERTRSSPPGRLVSGAEQAKETP